MTPTWESDCGTVKLWLGDCLDVMKTWPNGAVDAVVTDPPYGEAHTHSGHLSSVLLKDKTPAGQALGFDGMSGEQCVRLTQKLTSVSLRWAVFTCEWKYAHLLDEAGLLVRFGIWRKPDGAPQFTGDRPGTGWECVAVCHRPGRKRWNGGGRHAVWTHAKGQNRSGHPTGKPIGLLVDLVRDFSDEGCIVADPFMGSGTTGVAAVHLGRQFWGVELDPGYFETAKRRIQDELRKVAFLEPTKTDMQREMFA